MPETVAVQRHVDEVRPGVLFLDQNGDVAQLHGIGILQVNERFFAWGEQKSAGGLFSAVTCYSSEDLVHWRREGDSLTAGDGDLGSDRVVERPKVLYNGVSNRYVMLLHVDTADYSAARLGFAVSDDPVGPYRYLGSGRPLGNVSRDLGVFSDIDGTAYVLSEDRDNGLHLYQLARDFLSVERVVSTTLKSDGSHGYESPALIRVDDLYYLFGSDLTGWQTNDNMYCTSRSLEGPWSAWRPFAPTGSKTFNSQISSVLTITGTEQTSHFYIGDRWNRDDLFSSAPVWLPLELKAGEASLTWVDAWSVDVPTGRVRVHDSGGDERPVRAQAGLCSVTLARLTVDEVIAAARQAGLSCIEWSTNDHVPIENPSTAASIGERTRTGGMRVASLGSYFRAGSHGSLAEEHSEWLKVLQTAEALGAPRIRVWAGSAASAQTRPDERRRTVAALARMVAEAGLRDLEVAVEFHSGTVNDSAEACLALLAEVDAQAGESPGRLGTYWQPPNGMPTEEALSSFRRIEHRICALHVFSWWPDDLHRLPLRSRTDLWQPVLASADTTRRLDALLEFVDDGTPAAVTRDAATLRQWAASARSGIVA